MIVKIHQSHKTMAGTLMYNQRKAINGKADFLGAFNMDDDDSFHGCQRTFERYERLNYRTGDISFQLSINPDPDRPGEALSDDEALAMAKDVLKGLGYDGQPYMVYKHHDIQRIHYHVLSIRTNEKGRKINDSFEELKLQKLLESLKKEYHYEIGNKNEQEKGKREKTKYVDDTPRFNPTGSDVRQQYADLFDEALNYHFTTPVQFMTIMHSMGVDVDFLGDGYEMSLEGLDEFNRQSNARITQKDLGIDLFALYEKRRKENEKSYKEFMERVKEKTVTDSQADVRFQEIRDSRARVGKTVTYCMEHAQTLKHFERMLQKCGIAMTLSRNPNDEVFGATFSDRRSRAAFKASDLKKILDMGRLQQLANPGGDWETNQEALVQQWKDKRKEHHIQMNMDLAAQQTPREIVPEKYQPRPRFPDAGSFVELALVTLMEILLGTPVKNSRPVKKTKTLSNHKTYR